MEGNQFCLVIIVQPDRLHQEMVMDGAFEKYQSVIPLFVGEGCDGEQSGLIETYYY